MGKGGPKLYRSQGEQQLKTEVCSAEEQVISFVWLLDHKKLKNHGRSL